MTKATSSTLGVKSNPNQSTTNGAMATKGSVWLMTKMGKSARRTRGMKSSTIDKLNATVSDKANPAKVAFNVGTVLSHSKARFWTIWSSTRDGAGSISGEMPDRRT